MNWLDDDSYAVLSSICDALLPKLSEDTINNETLESSFTFFCSILFDTGVVNKNEMLQKNQFLQSGALELGIPRLCAEAIGTLTLKEDKMQIYGLLKALSTSAGCLLLFGHFNPFQKLSLDNRIMALKQLRDSRIQPLRSAFQVL